jgi:hypothetical protein
MKENQFEWHYYVLNKYPNNFINEQFQQVLLKFNINQLLAHENYNSIRNKIIETPMKEKIPVDHSEMMFIHFTHCSNMRSFPIKFHLLWQKYFAESPISPS